MILFSFYTIYTSKSKGILDKETAVRIKAILKKC